MDDHPHADIGMGELFHAVRCPDMVLFGLGALALGIPSMRRRKFLILVGSGMAAACPLAVPAQQTGIRRIGVFSPFAENDADAQATVTAFRQALQKLGWTEGNNLRIDMRWGYADPARIRAQAAELATLKPDVILVITSLVLEPLLLETRSIPIVFTMITDPVDSGFVASLAKPGGNITGFAFAEFPMFGKLLEVLKEIAPRVTHVAVLLNPDQKPQLGMLRAIEAAAPAFGLRLTTSAVRDVGDIERAISEVAHEPNTGLVVLPNPITSTNRKLIIAMAARHRLPAIYGFRRDVEEGGLVFYGADRVEQFRQSASYVDRILRGEKAGDLPIQQPTKFELVVNLKTAKAMGLTIPETFLVRADEVIE
jgi:putative ABC transport system substrate-binding protein